MNVGGLIRSADILRPARMPAADFAGNHCRPETFGNARTHTTDCFHL
jgi:hypothetical protein